MPDASGRIVPISVPNVPWHTNHEHDNLPNLLKCCRDADTEQWFCNGETCKSCDCPRRKDSGCEPNCARQRTSMPTTSRTECQPGTAPDGR